MLQTTDVSQLNTSSGYKFSATKLDKLGATEYTLATIVVDASSSVSGYGAQLETALKTVFKACDKSPRRDYLMLRLTQFANNLKELHGFKLLGSIVEKDYDNVLNIGGSTALFDAVDEAIQATTTYGKQLMQKDFFCNAIVVVITDGENNVGNIMDAPVIKKSLEQARRSENLESILMILVGVTGDDVNLNTYLQTVKDDAGFDSYISIGTATPGKVAKLATFVSNSISSTSQALGTGQASTPISNFTF